MTQSP